MKIKESFVLTELGDATIAVPVGKAADDFHGIVRLNSSGGFIMKALMDGLEEKQIEEKLMAEYEGLDREKAHAAVRSIVDKLIADGILEV